MSHDGNDGKGEEKREHLRKAVTASEDDKQTKEALHYYKSKFENVAGKSSLVVLH
jgi:hypothetical protein